MKINIQSLFICFFSLINIVSVSGQWMETNGPYADNITAFHFTKDLSFAGSYRNGIYRSTDMGKNWESTSYDYGSKVTCFVTINDTIFAGTYEQDVYRSVDSGYSWTRLTNGYFGNERVTSMIVHQDKIYAGTYGNGIFVCNDRKNFRPINGTLPTEYITSLISSDNILFAGTGSSGIFYSTDNGDNWFSSNNGLGDTSITSLSSGNGFILAGTNTGIFHSSDKGISWIASIGLPRSQIKSICLHNNEFYASSRGIYRSSNNGENWVAAGLNDITIASVASSGSILFAGCGFGLSGIFSSTDNGITWSQNNNGINKATVRTVVSQNSVLFAGADDAGIFRSTNGGSTWEQINSELKIYSMAVKGYSIYAGTTRGLYRSTDGGKQWIHIGPNDNFVYSICTLDNYLFIGTGSVDCYVYRSSDYGNSWDKVLTPYPPSSVITMCTNNKTLFAANDESSYRSTDYGDTWTQLSGVYSPATYFAINGNIYAGCTDPGIYRSTDNGDSWTQINNGLTTAGSPIRVYALSGIGDLIFAGTFLKGVFKSTDEGELWIQDGLSESYVYSLHINDIYLYAALYQNGVWVRKLDEIASELDKVFKLQQNYPNPFNPGTTISWHSPIDTRQTIKVYDILGREIITLVDEYKPAGDHEAEFDGSNLASGIYFYQLNAGSFIRTKKMILMK